MPFSLQPKHLSRRSYYTQTPPEYKRLLVRAHLFRDGRHVAEIGRFAMPGRLWYRRKEIIVDGFVKKPISALRFIPLSLRRTARTPHATGVFAFANVTLQALTCFCLFGHRPKIQATRAAGGR